MLKPIFTALALFTGALTVTSPLVAQSDNIRVTVANLKQDVALMTQQMKALRLEMEQMRRENAALSAQVTAARSNQHTQAQITNLATAIETLRREYRAADEAQKKAILNEVTRQIKALAKETQDAINTVAKATNAQPNVSATVHFSDDYPKTGKTYTVRSGDTLSKIARDHGSNAKDIQNANKIANPSRDLQVGQTIFIPIAQ